MGECWWPCCHDFLFSSSSPLHKLDYKSTGKLLCSTSLFLLFHFYHRAPRSLFAGVPFNLHIPCADRTPLFNSTDSASRSGAMYYILCSPSRSGATFALTPSSDTWSKWRLNERHLIEWQMTEMTLAWNNMVLERMIFDQKTFNQTTFKWKNTWKNYT